MNWLGVILATPAHSSLSAPLTYSSEQVCEIGCLVRVPLGQREVLGVVWSVSAIEADYPSDKVKPIVGVLDLPALSTSWRELMTFSAHYYQRSVGEIALAALPPQLRELQAVQLARRLKRAVGSLTPDACAAVSSPLVELSQEQKTALDQFAADTRPSLLFGATGSGKTEVYLRAAEQVLREDAQAQVLVMVPEINLTPQLQARFTARLGVLVGEERVVCLHSALTPAQRLKSWLAAHMGQARVVLGTRMAALASLPHLRLIVVDEEHDPSYKQQEGARYSARDLSVYRAKSESGQRAPGYCRVLLGSATPSLESWQATLTGRYQCLTLHQRIGACADAGLPAVRMVDMRLQPKHCVIAPSVLAAISERVARGEQALIFLNRRGYAPVLTCHACEWKSDCAHCSAYRVFHKTDRTLRCHHCGFTERVPRACPKCGNPDIAPVGRGTQRLEEHLQELLAGVQRADGSPVRIARIDADSTRAKGALHAQLAQVHEREVDVLVGTQMIAKGHDFRHITLVVAVNPDSALFSSDFRAPERLFALLMQATGRAGRDAAYGAGSQMWVQTFVPAHPLFAALKKHDYPGFAHSELAARRSAGLPPFGFCALVRAQARSQQVAQDFLNAARDAAQELPGQGQVTLYSAIPDAVQRVANVERAQLLVEGASRVALQAFLAAWHTVLTQTRQRTEFRSLLRWAVDVDPLSI